MPVANRCDRTAKNAEFLHNAVLSVNIAIRPSDNDGRSDVKDVPYRDLGPKTKARYEALVSLLVSLDLWKMK